MTRIRRINVSQVEGGGADSTDTNEIRPTGETAFYLDEDNKLTLMMFGGTRTHLKSKILAPGRLYGSDADSGDGNNYDTIKLIPDAQLFSDGSDQYIVVDPTSGAPGHIHIRAGGTQDASGADLYLGGEQTFVRVSDTTDDVVIRTGLSAAIENVGVAVVDELVPPGGVWRLFINDSTYPTLGNTVQIGETVTTTWGTPITTTIVDIQQDAGNWQIHVDQDITVGFNAFNTVTFNRGSRSWTFDSTGALTFPDGYLTIQDSQGGVIVKAADEKSISLISSGDGSIGSAIGWYDNFLVPTKLAAVVANNPFYVGEGDVGIVTGGIGTNTNIWNFAADGTIAFPSNKIKAPISSNISIETEVPISDPPTTIVISGADFTSVNLTYTKDGANSLWYPAGYNPSTDPYIEFGMGFGIFVPGFDQALYVNTGTLNIPLAQWNTNPPLGSVAPTGVYTYPGTYTRAWQFGTDGIITLPNGQTIDGSTGDESIQIGGTSTWIAIDNNGAPPGFVVATDVGGAEHRWTFANDGALTLPNSGIISDGMGAIRLEPSGVSSSTQALLIYPTAGDGNHIHLTAGGGETDLYLGSDIQYVKVDHGGTVVVGTVGANTSTWTFGTDGTLTFPQGGTIADTTTTMILTPNSPGQSTSLVLRSTYNSYMTADYPTDQSYQQYLHQLDPVTYPDPYESTGTEGTVISITLWDAQALQYLQGDVEYIITGTGITAADFTPAVLTGTFAAANWVLDGGGFNYTNTNIIAIANDAIVEGQETFTITIITTGTYAGYSGSNYLRVNIADGTSEGSESGHIHLISENMAQTSIFLGNDEKYVKVASDDQVYINVPNVDTSGTSQTWTFSTDGGLTFPDGTTQTTAWLSGTVSSVQTYSLTTFIPETGTFTNTNQLTVSYQAYSTDYGFNFTIDYQSPLDETKGVTVGAINTPLILSTSSIKVRADLSTSTEWTFGTDGSLTFPDGTTQTTAFNFIDTIPVSSTSTGIKGQIAVNTASMYVCIATNSWLRFDGVTF